MTVNLLQCTFSGGEVSEGVAARVDLPKYQEALLRAKNVFIRPYGGLEKRPGTLFVKKLTPPFGRERLVRFAAGAGKHFLLLFTAGKLEAYLDDVLRSSLSTPFDDEDVRELDFAQSANTLFIASGRHPVKRLFREADDVWTLEDLPVLIPPFAETRRDVSLSPSAAVGQIILTASQDLFAADWAGRFLNVYQEAPATTVDVPAAGSVSAAVLVGAGWSFVTRGNWTGTITIEKLKTEDGKQKGDWLKFKEYKSDYTTDTASNAGANFTDSGAAEGEPFFLRISSSGSGSYAPAAKHGTLTANGLFNQGVVKVVSVTDNTHAAAEVIKPLAQGNGSIAVWAAGLWDPASGYPRAVSFFQDRLALAGSSLKPNGLWFSKTGDYTNFDVTEAAGKLTDDSAVNTAVIARDLFDIRALVSANDFLIFTSGNVWLVAGSAVLKPSELNIRMQTGFGASFIAPLCVGSRTLYVQEGRTKLRDAGYSFESDGYLSEDLTVLSDHLLGDDLTIEDIKLVEEPECKVFVLRSDGVLLCLTYLREQKVFAWSTVETEGRFTAIGAVRSGTRDVLYAVVERDGPEGAARFLEKFAPGAQGDFPAAYCLLDCAESIAGNASTTVTGLSRFAGRRVAVTGDDALFDEAGYAVDADGVLELPYLCERLYIGLPYEMEIALPDVHANLNGSGSTLGHLKVINKVLLRLHNSFGGEVSTGESAPAREIFTLAQAGRNMLEADLRVRLRSGVFAVTLSQDTNYYGRVTLRHWAALPFKLSALSREVKFT